MINHLVKNVEISCHFPPLPAIFLLLWIHPILQWLAHYQYFIRNTHHSLGSHLSPLYKHHNHFIHLIPHRKRCEFTPKKVRSHLCAAITWLLATATLAFSVLCINLQVVFRQLKCTKTTVYIDASLNQPWKVITNTHCFNPNKTSVWNHSFLFC